MPLTRPVFKCCHAQTSLPCATCPQHPTSRTQLCPWREEKQLKCQLTSAPHVVGHYQCRASGHPLRTVDEHPAALPSCFLMSQSRAESADHNSTDQGRGMCSARQHQQACCTCQQRAAELDTSALIEGLGSSRNPLSHAGTAAGCVAVNPATLQSPGSLNRATGDRRQDGANTHALPQP